MAFKFAFLGCWHSHTGMHVRESTANPSEFELVGIYDNDPVVVAERREQWDAYVFPSIEAVLDSDIDAVVVEGRIFENLDYAEQALKAGKHVLLEKPAGVDLDHLKRVQALSLEKDLCLQMAYMWRYNPAIHEMIRLVKAGTLGDIFYYRGHIPKPKGWHKQIGEEIGYYHGAVYYEMGGHLVDLMVILMGRPKHVHPMLGKHYGDQRHIDNAVVVHEFENGLGTIDTAAMHIESGKTRRIEVYGTQGTAIHTPIGSNNLSLCLELEAEGYSAGWHDLEIPSSENSSTLLRELVACIGGKKAPDYALSHDLDVQETLFAGCGIKDGKALK
jgi:predicted dehydrogenase